MRKYINMVCELFHSTCALILSSESPTPHYLSRIRGSSSVIVMTTRWLWFIWIKNRHHWMVQVDRMEMDHGLDFDGDSLSQHFLSVLFIWQGQGQATSLTEWLSISFPFFLQTFLQFFLFLFPSFSICLPFLSVGFSAKHEVWRNQLSITNSFAMHSLPELIPRLALVS